jgi:hypothetical protein
MRRHRCSAGFAAPAETVQTLPIAPSKHRAPALAGSVGRHPAPPYGRPVTRGDGPIRNRSTLAVEEGGNEMKAIVQRSYGGPETLELADLDRPTVGPNDVLVRRLDTCRARPRSMRSSQTS